MKVCRSDLIDLVSKCAEGDKLAQHLREKKPDIYFPLYLYCVYGVCTRLSRPRDSRRACTAPSELRSLSVKQNNKRLSSERFGWCAARMIVGSILTNACADLHTASRCCTRGKSEDHPENVCNRSTMALKSMADITRSPKQGYQ